MTTKAVLIEVEVPEGEEIYYYATRKIQPYSLFNGFYQRHTTFRHVPPARAVPDCFEIVRSRIDGDTDIRVTHKNGDGELSAWVAKKESIEHAHEALLWELADSLLSPPAEPARAAGDEREAFEKWWRSGQGWSIGLVRDGNGYQSSYANDSWKAWQARALLAAAPAESKWGDIQQRQDDYAAGWRRCAEWANRDDLPCDVGSPAYLKDMAADLSVDQSAQQGGEGL